MLRTKASCLPSLSGVLIRPARRSRYFRKMVRRIVQDIFLRTCGAEQPEIGQDRPEVPCGDGQGAWNGREVL